MKRPLLLDTLPVVLFMIAISARAEPKPVTKPVTKPDPALPQPLDATVIAPVVQSSPFTRMVNMSDNLVLTGIANIKGKPVATIYNKETKQSYIVSEEPNQQGWKLTEAIQTPDITRSQAKITINNEVISVRYDSTAMTAENLKKDRPNNNGGGPGPAPGGGGDSDRFRRDRGPSEEGRRAYESLSEAGKEKLRNAMREKFSDEKFRNAPEDERRNIMRREFERIQREDGGSSGGGSNRSAGTGPPPR